MSTKRTRVPLARGLHLATLAAGPRDAPSILFVHGIAQSKQAFARVLAGPLAQTHRLVAVDLPGHGDSDAPAAGSAFTRAMLAADLAAVIAHHELVTPWLAGWSFGGSVLGEYLRAFGDTGLGGLIFLAGAVRTGRDAATLYGPAMMTYARPLLSEDPAIYAEAARGFLRDAAHVPVADPVLHAEMLRVPSHVRRSLLAGGEDYVPAIAATQVPIATLHGARDRVVLPAMSDLVAVARPDVTAITLPDAGHMPWLETPDAFDAVLAQLVTPGRR